jgi:hypothetical protein
MLSTGKAVRARARGLWLVSQILLAIQILSFGHLLSSRHVTCLEHGDIIHVRHAERAALGTPDPGARGSAWHSMAATESSAEAEHDHCLACADAGRRYLLIGSAQPVVVPQILVSSIRSARSAFFAPVDLILLSPKNSPPLA